ncbi:MAG: hydroxysqualene dehydroxylase HpnE [Burkholderiaceae bacterium]|nr:hydroxysqualene dehydroxylase HpnE [Burkholderiaceae bacterium]
MGAESATRLAVVGAGWAGIAAAVEASTRGAQVTLYEMAHQAGGRARSRLEADGWRDNGQHILIGAYTDTLALMRRVGADAERLLWRGPLALRYPDGSGLQLPPGAALSAFARGVWAQRGWSRRERLALLAAAGSWLASGFEAGVDESTSVARLCAGLPPRLRDELVDPLCVAALNTPAEAASARVFLRVLRDALFSGRGSADLLLPRAPLHELLPRPALHWLARRGAGLRLGQRVQTLAAAGGGRWQVDGEAFDAVVLACPPGEAARLVQALAPDWAAGAATLRHEPIVTAWLRDPQLRLPQPMLALRSGPAAPAQFLFDLGALGQAPGEFSAVLSGAAEALRPGLPALGATVLAQLRQALPGAFAGPDHQVLLQLVAERRATFACTPGLRRPAAAIAPGLWAAGDHVAGPYPATLEGAVRSGLAAARALVPQRPDSRT